MDQNFWLLGIHRKIIASGTDTNGTYDLVAGYVPPGIKTPPHIHHQYIETEYVIKGELSIQTPTGTILLQAGEGYTIPKGMPHALIATGDEPAHIITVFAPAGFAEVIRAAGFAGTIQDGAPVKAANMEIFNSLSTALGDETIGPPGSPL
ncbi:cupin domain-containing protein [Mucilaginibacter defluvii]|uniref:Cupin type-2 domain-containing protein n=1 Tax=Mucilaginibacter defluvii TaxID=1196019 RepID=A0ABP9G9S4_9SPHI